MKTGITVKGINKLVRELKRSEDVELLTHLKAANAEAAGLVHADAAHRTPIRDGTLLATLRGSATERRGVVRAGSKKVPYAGVIHFGWPKRNIRPQPFLYDALDARTPQVLDAYERHVQRVLDVLAARSDGQD